MEIEIKPSVAKGVIKAPPSKSYAHRYLIAGALSRKATIRNISYSNDILATLSGLSILGYAFKKQGDEITFNGNKIEELEISAGESGSTLRFLIPLSLIKFRKIKFIGTKKLFSRGLDVYLDIFNKQNIKYELGEDYLSIEGKLQPGQYILPGNISSQYITGLLFALPLLDDDSEIRLNTELESKGYVDLSLEVLREFGIEIVKEDNTYFIKGKQIYQPGLDEIIEGDYSNAAFLEAFNYLGGDVKISGLNEFSRQSDKSYLEFFPLLYKSHPTISLKNNIDLGPILFVFASLFNGAIFTDIKRLRIKESDRIKDMLSILELYGVKYELSDNKLEIFKSELFPYLDVIHPVNDHRIVMASIILLSKLGGRIDNVEAINKSYPNFIKDIKSLGIEVSYVDR